MTLRIALQALARNKLRTLLTMLGMIIGVAAVIAMLSIGTGAQMMVKERMEAMGTNPIHISPVWRRGRGRGGGAGGSRTLMTVKDWKAVDALPEVMTSCPMVTNSAQLIYGSSNWSTSVYGTTEGYLVVRNWEVTEGRFFNQSEIDTAANVVVLGAEARNELFGSADAVGETIRIKNLPFKVIGLLQEKGNSGGGSRDNSVVIPYTTDMQKVSGQDYLDYMSCAAPDRDKAKALEKVVVDFLNQRHRVEDAEDGGFEAQSLAEASKAADESTEIFKMLLGGIASVSLLVGGIGIMNIMLVSVTERVREIGIRMAVGARGQDILAQFLTEAVVLSLVGGGMGVLLGWGISTVVAKLVGWPAIVSASSVILAFGTSAFIGIFFGFYPALSASKLDPIEALRS